MNTNQILKGKKGIIFGALDENSIAWKVAEKAHAEGAEFVLSNAPVALRKKDIFQLAEKTNSQVIAADVTQVSEIEDLYQEAMKILGGKVDFILHSVGMSPNVRKSIPYEELNYDYFLKTLDISAISLHKMLSVAKKMDVINDWGSVVALSYIAAQKVFSSYSDMSQAKAMLESIVRQFGYHYGRSKKVRINAVSQSPTITTAGSGVSGFNAFFNYANNMSPLGNADAEACADYCISLFSDYTRMVTMQTLYHDGGFSSMGISNKLIDQFINCAGNNIE
ncbi:MAG: SDR family oxidoreductase [Bacteroidales bacterium]|jgi:enoyl-[acyl-carrier protein] reductase I|nr:SDR family oxidoreductase [Bacteroidales bacterium]